MRWGLILLLVMVATIFAVKSIEVGERYETAYQMGVVMQCAWWDIACWTVYFLETVWLMVKIIMAASAFLIGFKIGSVIFKKYPVEIALIVGVWSAVFTWYFAGVLFAMGVVTVMLIILLAVFTPLGSIIGWLILSEVERRVGVKLR